MEHTNKSNVDSATTRASDDASNTEVSPISRLPVELLEKVLECLPLEDLVVAQGVCKAFAKIINPDDPKGSKWRKLMFLSAGPNDDHNPVLLTDDTPKKVLFGKEATKYISDKQRNNEVPPASRNVYILNPALFKLDAAQVINNVTIIDHLSFYLKHGHYPGFVKIRGKLASCVPHSMMLSPSASCMKMQVCYPPAKRLYVWIMESPDSRIIAGEFPVINPTGVTFGELVQSFLECIRERYDPLVEGQQPILDLIRIQDISPGQYTRGYQPLDAECMAEAEALVGKR